MRNIRLLIIATASLQIAWVPMVASDPEATGVSRATAVAGGILEGLGVSEDIMLNMGQLLTKYGYPFEIHYITTADDYIIKCYRIIKCSSNTKLPLVLMHGLQANSLDFVAAGNGKALGYLAGAACYDTWLCNSRGNFESRNHTALDPSHRDFWQFSWHEMGQYDLPAIFKKVLQVTGKKKLNYVGYSQGTTQIFVYCSLYPEESKEVLNHVHALAPVAILKHTSSPLFLKIAKTIRSEKMLSETLGIYEIWPKNHLTPFAAPICSLKKSFVTNVCAGAIFFVAGDDQFNDRFNRKGVQLFLANDPSGSSFKQFAHFSQLIKTGKFQYYDYNLDSPNGNMKHYGQPTPPLYPIEKIQVPMTFYYARNDFMANHTDVVAFSKLIPNVTLYEIPDPTAGHLALILAKDVRTLVNDIVLANLEK